jgi:hypothetical protein
MKTEAVIFLINRADLAQKLGFTLDAIQILQQVQKELQTLWKTAGGEEREKIMHVGYKISHNIAILWFRLQKECQADLVPGEDR